MSFFDLSVPESEGENCFGIEALLQEQVLLNVLAKVSFTESDRMSQKERFIVLSTASEYKRKMEAPSIAGMDS